MQQKEEIYKTSNEKQITIMKSVIPKADHTNKILIIHYAQYINMFEQFVNKYNVPLIKIRLISYFKNALGVDQDFKVSLSCG